MFSQINRLSYWAKLTLWTSNLNVSQKKLRMGVIHKPREQLKGSDKCLYFYITPVRMFIKSGGSKKSRKFVLVVYAWPHGGALHSDGNLVASRVHQTVFGQPANENPRLELMGRWKISIPILSSTGSVYQFDFKIRFENNLLLLLYEIF